MRLALALILFPLAAHAADPAECKDFQARYKAMIAAVEARAPGLETDQRREKAEDYLRNCVEDDDRLAREAPHDPICAPVDGRIICR